MTHPIRHAAIATVLAIALAGCTTAPDQASPTPSQANQTASPTASKAPGTSSKAPGTPSEAPATLGSHIRGLTYDAHLDAFIITSKGEVRQAAWSHRMPLALPAQSSDVHATVVAGADVRGIVHSGGVLYATGSPDGEPSNVRTLVRSKDEGKTWEGVGESKEELFALDANEHHLVGFGTRLVVSKDGLTWDAIPDMPEQIFDVAISPDDTAIVCTTPAGLAKHTLGKAGFAWMGGPIMVLADYLPDGRLVTFGTDQHVYVQDGEAWHSIANVPELASSMTVFMRDGQAYWAIGTTREVIIGTVAGKEMTRIPLV